jgi:ATP-dependent DNA helicase RecG
MSSHPSRALLADLAALSPGKLEEELVRRPEDQWFEKKGPAVAVRDLAKVVVGMANTAGGVVAVGVEQSERRPGRQAGRAGVDRNEIRIQELADSAVKLTMPPVPCHVHFLKLPRAEVMLIDVESSEEVHTLTNDECYLRVGSETRRLTFAERRELTYDKGRSFFDAKPVEGAGKKNLNLAQLSAWAGALGAGDPVQLAKARGLVTGEGAPTVAGLVVFGKSPTSFFPECYIRVVRHIGIEARPGRAMAVSFDRRFEAALPKAIDEAFEATNALLTKVERLGWDGRFERETLYPPFAVREAITNAAVHRSYSLGGDHIRVSVFDDRIEVESPGRLPSLVREDNIRTTRFARNPHIARVMAELAYGREFGEGVDRMFQEMAAAGLPDPLIVQREASVLVTLLGQPALYRISAAIPGAGGAKLAEHLHQAGSITTREAEAILGVGRATAIKRLRALVELGLLERVAASPTDPTTFFRLPRR